MLSEKQQDLYYKDLHDITILSGVTGSGKSYISNLKFYAELCDAPKNSILLLTGKTNESLYKNVIKDLLTIDTGINWLKYSRNPGVLRVPHKNIDCLCVGIYSSGAADRIQGGNIWLWYADEITTYLKESVQMCLSRCRWTIKNELNIRPVIWTCNPASPQHYIKTEFIDAQDIDVKNYFYDFKDNPVITEKYITAQKKRYSGVFYERMIMGRWSQADGLVYSGFIRDIHVIDEIPTERIKEYILGVDWGYEHYLAILLIGIGEDGQYYVIKEICEKHQLIDKSLSELLTRRGFADYTINQAYCDSARPEYIDTFENLTGIPAMGAQKQVIEGIQAVQQKLKVKNNNEAHLYVHKDCTNTLGEFDMYQWAKGKGGINKDEPDKKNDDCMDALRYAIYTNEQYGDQEIIVL